MDLILGFLCRLRGRPDPARRTHSAADLLRACRHDFPGLDCALPPGRYCAATSGSDAPCARGVRPPSPSGYLSDRATTQRHADEIFTALEHGTLRLDISARYALDQVEIAHAALENRRQLGKSILLIA